jgi:hypothetical protein
MASLRSVYFLWIKMILLFMLKSVHADVSAPRCPLFSAPPFSLPDYDFRLPHSAFRIRHSAFISFPLPNSQFHIPHSLRGAGLYGPYGPEAAFPLPPSLALCSMPHALCSMLPALSFHLPHSDFHIPFSAFRIPTSPFQLASCKQGFNFTHDLFIFVKAQANGFPGTDAGAYTASVANGLINFNDAFI